MTLQIQHIEPTSVAAFLNSRDGGLSAREVADRRAELGANVLEAKRRFWWLRILVRQFIAFFSVLLDLAAAVSFVADHIQPGEGMLVMGWALLGVSVLNALFSFFQEFRAERAMEELRKFLPQKVIVRRDGEDREIPADDIVPGDVLVLQAGQRAPADARLVEGRDIVVNNAPLTGESEPIALDAKAAEAELPITESRNIVFAGCQVLKGSGLAIVFATGLRTEFGKIALLSHEVRRNPSPLERETAHMVRVLTVIAVAMGLTFFTYGVITERSLWANLVFMMGIIVANVPEGLLPTFTLSLAMGSLRMARRNVLVKGLNAVEALGAVHVVCTDKTGTLTLNRLSVTQVAGTTEDEAAADTRRRCLEAALIASDVEAGETGFVGDPLDVAVARIVEDEIGDAAGLVAAIARRFPFDTEKRRSAGIGALDGETVFACKGAWEAISPMLAEGDYGAVEDIVHDLARQGLRVIAVAQRALPENAEAENDDALANDLTLLGFLGLEDPIRPEVPDAIAKCRRAGIDVMMITGDHPDTAIAVARRAGMLAADEPPERMVVLGSEIETLRRAELVERLRDGTRVIARATPEQKLKIVAALHELDRVVAMTGDGVNDAPALKAADVGIAMGRSGTDVAREAAQVVLLDDNFASIVAGIEEGRTIFANIRKFTNYVLVSNGPEIIPYLVYMLLPVPLALTVIQILSIDLCTDIVPSMALGQEPPDRDTMERPPKDRRAKLLDWPVIAHSYFFLGLIEAAFSFFLFFLVLHQGGWQYGQEMDFQDPLYRSATGIALASIMLMQIGNLFGRRSRFGSGLDRGLLANPLIVIGILLEAVLSWAILYFPPVAGVLGTGPVDPAIYALAWLGPFLIFGLDYVRKLVARHLHEGSEKAI